jgi:hypothetical protein
MMRMPNLDRVKVLKLTVCIVTIILLGFLRLYLFENINHQLAFIYYENEVSYVTEELSFIADYSYDTLMSVKWLLTIFFTIGYLALTLGIINILFSNKEFIHITLLIFSLIVFASFLLYFIFGFFNESALGYRLARFCMGVVQSPLPLMILIPAFKLADNK